MTLNDPKSDLAQSAGPVTETRPDTLPLQGIVVSEDEQQSRVLSSENQKLAAVILSCRGYVILKDALPKDYVRTIGHEMSEIYEDCRSTLGAGETGSDAESQFVVHESKVKRAAFWYRKSRWRIFPKLVPPMSDPLLLANPFVMPVLEQLLGSQINCHYVSSDICVKGAILQSPHSDIDMDDAIVNNRWVPRGFIVNVPVMDCGLHNGPLEVWPGGSHMWSSDLMHQFGLEPNIQDGRNPAVEQVAEYFPSIKVALKPGEILIRDLAMWHRGTPNPTDEPRSMLTIAYFRKSRGFGYGDVTFNLDQYMYEKLDERTRALFAHHFNMKRALRQRLKGIRASLHRRLSKGA